MPRVNTQRKSRAGKTIRCQRCGREILPGENYLKWSFRYGGSHYACSEHPPRPSELTQSAMGEVYAAIESAQDDLPNAESLTEVRELVEAVIEIAQQVMEQYRDAAEPFGGAGENAERADGLEGWIDELQNFEPAEPDDDDDDAVKEAALRTIVDEVVGDLDAVSFDDLDAVISVFMVDEGILAERIEEEREKSGALAEGLNTAREEAEGLLGSCPV